MPEDDTQMVRWRLVLGRFAEDRLQSGLAGDAARADQALEYLYSREYEGRGVRQHGKSGEGGLDPSQLNVPRWLNEIRDLFPRETAEIIEHHALERYGMQELVTDPEVLRRLEPSLELLKSILTFKGQMSNEVLVPARRLIRQVVEDLTRRLEADVRNAIMGRLNRQHHSPLRVARNLDVKRTIRQNLKHWDPQRRRLVIERPQFFARLERRLPWRLVLAVDQSGSMLDSVIHSAVFAGILAGLPSLDLRLIVFDTNIVDLSDHADDPVEVLMSVQLGGGTLIGQALGYCETLVQVPSRTVVVLLSDFCEGADPRTMLACVKRLREANVRVLCLGALDADARGAYDREMAARLAEQGAEVAALTPKHFAQWLGQVLAQ